MRVADHVFDILSDYDISDCFSVTGRGSLFLTDALKNNTKINEFFFHHEQSAAFAAVSYAQLTGKAGCCLVSTGCASTNTITGVLSAWQDGIPSIFISGQNTLNETTRNRGIKIRTFGQQEADIVSLVKPITKYSVMIEKPEQIEKELQKAIQIANTSPKGPVWVDIPVDIQDHRIEKKYKKIQLTKKIYKCKKSELNYIYKSLLRSKKPALLIGSGIKSAGAENLFKKFVRKFKIPVTYTHSSSDIYRYDNEFCIGSVGSQGCTRAGAFVVQNSDLLIILGSRVNSLTTGPDRNKFARNAKIIAVDIDKNEFKKNNIKINKLILSDLEFFLKEMIKFNSKVKWDAWNKIAKKWKKNLKKFDPNEYDKGKIGLYQLSKTVSNLLSNNSIFICDSGFIDVIMPNNIEFKKNQKCLHPVSQGSMGYAIPAILGAHVADRNKDILCVVGDGSLMMNLQELQTIKNYKSNPKIIVINNNMYGIIRRRQKELFRDRTVGTDATNGVTGTNIKQIAKCFDFKYFKINKTQELKNKLKNILKYKGPVICEIMAILDQDYIEIGYAKNSKGIIVRRPLEDQKPFIKREIFLKEMIIKPIDQ